MFFKNLAAKTRQFLWRDFTAGFVTGPRRILTETDGPFQPSLEMSI